MPLADILWTADWISASVYPAFRKLCFALESVSPRSNAFFTPPINSSDRFGVGGATILGRLHLA